MQMCHICMPFGPMLTHMGEEMSVDSPRGRSVVYVCAAPGVRLNSQSLSLFNASPD